MVYFHGLKIFPFFRKQTSQGIPRAKLPPERSRRSASAPSAQSAVGATSSRAVPRPKPLRPVGLWELGDSLVSRFCRFVDFSGTVDGCEITG